MPSIPIKVSVRFLGSGLHGLCIYPEDIPVTFSALNAAPLKSPTMVTFVREFASLFVRASGLTPRESLAYELYSLVHSMPSIRSRFLVLWDALECLYPAAQGKDPFIDTCNSLRASLLRDGTSPAGTDPDSVCRRMEEIIAAGIARAAT